MIKSLFDREPTAILNTVRLAVLAGVTFGLNVSEKQLLAIMVFLEMGLLPLMRQLVTSTATLHDAGLSKTEVHEAALTNRAAMSGLADGSGLPPVPLRLPDAPLPPPAGENPGRLG